MKTVERILKENDNLAATVGANVMDAINMVRMARRQMDRHSLQNEKDPTGSSENKALNMRLAHAEKLLYDILNNVKGIKL